MSFNLGHTSSIEKLTETLAVAELPIGKAQIKCLLSLLRADGESYSCPCLVDGDGSCFFHAIISQLRSQLSQLSYQPVKKARDP
jgi:hypothetical protein